MAFLDPFLGSVTTAKIAIELNRNIIGYEITEQYLSAIQDKLQNNNVKIIKKKVAKNNTCML